MEQITGVAMGYGIIMSIIGFLVMGYDKQLAIKGKRRISEQTLFGIALVGGAAGVWSGMYFFRHKTKHTTFQLGIPLLLLVNTYVFIELIKKGM